MACRLCGEPHVYNIHSHLAPRAITQSTFGKADHEEIYTIDIHAASFDVFHGRAHPQAKPDVIKPLPNTAKGIFCKKCENGFGQLEAICQPLLVNAFVGIADGTLPVFKIEKGLVAFTLPIHVNIFNLFFLSVIWRECVSSEIEVGNLILTQGDFDSLQNSLVAEIHKTKKEIEQSPNFVNYPLVTVFTAINRGKTEGFVNPSALVTNPEVFFIGDYSCLFFKNAPHTKYLFKSLGVPFALQQISGDKAAHKTTRVILIEERFYDGIVQLSIKHSVNLFFEIHAKRIALHRGIGIMTAHYILRQTTMRFYYQNNMQDYTKCLIDASAYLCQ